MFERHVMMLMLLATSRAVVIGIFVIGIVVRRVVVMFQRQLVYLSTSRDGITTSYLLMLLLKAHQPLPTPDVTSPD